MNTTNQEKTNKETLKEYKDILRQLYFDRVPRKEFIEPLSKKWNLTPRRIDYLIKEIKEELKELEEEDSQRIYNYNLTRLKEIAENTRHQSPAVAIKAISELNKMAGLHKNNVDITSNGEPIQLTISKEFLPKE